MLVKVKVKSKLRFIYFILSQTLSGKEVELDIESKDKVS